MCPPRFLSFNIYDQTKAKDEPVIQTKGLSELGKFHLARKKWEVAGASNSSPCPCPGNQRLKQDGNAEPESRGLSAINCPATGWLKPQQSLPTNQAKFPVHQDEQNV